MNDAKSSSISKPAYEQSRVAVDIVAFSIVDEELQVYLQEREKPPFEGRGELPGGLLLQNETAEQTVERKLKDMFDLRKVKPRQFQTFTNPSRDPRTRTVTIGFIALIRPNSALKGGAWYPMKKLPALAFDHAEIIRAAREYLLQLEELIVARELLATRFSLNELQNVIELIHEKKYDNRNFRRRLLMDKRIKETDAVTENVSHRPARLFEFA